MEVKDLVIFDNNNFDIAEEVNASEIKSLKCRLCCKCTHDGLMAFSDEGLMMNLQQHIKRYLHITVTMDDVLPKFLCIECANTLHNFHNFATIASQCQKKLIQAGKDKLEIKINVNKEINNVTIEHDYATVSKDDKISSTVTTKLKRTKRKRKKQTQEKKKNAAFLKENAFGTDFQNEITLCAISKDNFNDFNINNNNIIGDIDTIDSNTHETLEIVVDPNLYLESSSESFNVDTFENNNIKDKISDPCVCDFSAESHKCKLYRIDFQNRSVSDALNHDKNEEDTSFQCPICGKTTLTETSLKLHLRIHRPKGKHACDICKRTFKSYANLIQHKVYHTKVQFQCDICQRVYPTQSTLKAHAISHSNLRPHQCRLCEKSFKRNQDLKFHMNQHTGDRPYKCIYCPRSFASSGNCFSHRKRMHPHEMQRDREIVTNILR